MASLSGVSVIEKTASYSYFKLLLLCSWGVLYKSAQKMPRSTAKVTCWTIIARLELKYVHCTLGG